MIRRKTVNEFGGTINDVRTLRAAWAVSPPIRGREQGCV